MSQVFSRRADLWLGRIVVSVILGGILLVACVYYYGPPEYTRVGYAPSQPVPYSHAQHVGQLGMSCLYCHTNIEQSPHANVPTTQTCMNCHTAIKALSPLLTQVRESYATGNPVSWEGVHKVPDYVQFNHSVHVKRGVSCVSCHGKVNEMVVVRHEKPLSMGWCLDCHRHPEKNLRPNSEVYNLDWKPPQGETLLEVGSLIKKQYGIKALVECSSCHR